MNWYKHLKLAQNYYDISGEFWIDDSGNALDASEASDYNHEAYVIESIQLEVPHPQGVWIPVSQF